jgi:hypothetical protein
MSTDKAAGFIIRAFRAIRGFFYSVSSVVVAPRLRVCRRWRLPLPAEIELPSLFRGADCHRDRAVIQ